MLQSIFLQSVGTENAPKSACAAYIVANRGRLFKDKCLLSKEEASASGCDRVQNSFNIKQSMTE